MSIFDDLRGLFPQNTDGLIGAEDMVSVVDAMETLDAGYTKDTELEGSIATYLASGDATTIKRGGPDPQNEVPIVSEVLSNEVAHFNPQPTHPPVKVEGQVWYDDVAKALTVHNDVDMNLNLGQEEVIRVYNDTGSTLSNGKPVYQSGVVGGLPSVALAQADLVSTLVVPGITTHDIPTGTEGFITHAGTLGGDFSAFGIGDALFLSESVPGGYTVTPPDYATRLGTVLDNSSDGKLLVRIVNNTSLPTVIAYMNEAVDPAGNTIGTAYETIVNYQDSGNVGVPYDATAGSITCPYEGLYRVTFNLSMTFNSSTGARLFNLQLYNLTQATEVFTIPTTIAKDVSNYDSTISAPFTAYLNNVYAFRVSSPSGALTGVSYNFNSFDITSIHLR